MENTHDNSSPEINEIAAPKKRRVDILKIIYPVVIVLLIGALGYMGWLYNELKKSQKNLIVVVKNTTDAKESLAKEFNDLLGEYSTLKTNNAVMNVKLEAEQTRIKKLIDEIKSIKNASSYQIEQYKKELTTLREIMRSYIVQIDSLNTRNQVLTAENVKVKTDYTKSQDANKELNEKNEVLVEKVNKAAVIKALNLVAIPINKNSKEVNKSSKVDKVKVCFILSENIIAPAGMKDVYIRIARPDEVVITVSPDNYFTFEGEKIVYTEKRQVDYQNQNVDLCIYWKNNNESLTAGTYNVDVFTDGATIGKTTFALKK